ncbi:alpha-2,8-sialyltransferase 8B-like isoform X2 [Anneissia japonica]|nr:alpha-2,8-sialyltransferase 8B-like isoform X2 [Anneissia japonica]
MIFVLVSFDKIDDTLNARGIGNIKFRFQKRHGISVGNGVSVFQQNRKGQMRLLRNINKMFNNLNISKVQSIRRQLKKAGFSLESMLQFLPYDSNISDEENIFAGKLQGNNDDLLLKAVNNVETCAVVGNSGVLTNSNCGLEIDAHDVVLRTNMAPIEDYEIDVGKRTDLVSMNSAIAKFYYRCLRSNGTKCYQLCKNYLQNINRSTVWFSKLHGVPSYIYYNVVAALRKLKSDVAVTFPDRQLKAPLQKFWKLDSIPSSGVFLYTLAFTFCRKVSLYGFYPFNQTRSGQPLRFHYYENASFVNTHSMPIEFDMIFQLYKTGGLRIVTESCVS